MWWNTRALAHLRIGDPQTSLDAAARAIELEPHPHIDPRATQALAHVQMGNLAAARNAYEEAARLAEAEPPDDPDTRRLLDEAREALD